MGTIDVIAKWDLEKNCWNTNPDINQYGRSFAMASYERIINNAGKINYIIMAQGSRVEDHSKNGLEIKEKKLRVDYMLSHYKNRNENYDIKIFLMDADAPIIEDARLFAKYIDSLAVMPNTNTINIIGLSKCSAMSFYVPQFFLRPESYEKTNLYNIASPYTGTKLASPLVFYPELQNVIADKVGDNKLSLLIYNCLVNMYEKISSNSHMDYDIAIPNGIPTSKFDVYDKSFIENIFSQENINAVKKLNSFKNLVTGIDSSTLKEAIKTMNFVGIGLCLLDDIFFDNKSDGMVYVDAQRKVEEVLELQSYRLESSHHDVNSNIRVFSNILGVVDDTIEEANERKRLLKR